MSTENKNEPVRYQPGDIYEIPAEGSLGLLALGARGLDLWRKKRAETQKEKNQNPTGNSGQNEKS